MCPFEYLQGSSEGYEGLGAVQEGISGLSSLMSGNLVGIWIPPVGVGLRL